MRVMSEPKIEMLAAVHTRTKALLLQSGDEKGFRTNAEPTSTSGVRRVPADPALHSARSVRQNSRTTGPVTAPATTRPALTNNWES